MLKKCITICLVASLSGEMIPIDIRADFESLVGHFRVRNLILVQKNTDEVLDTVRGTFLLNLKLSVSGMNCADLKSRPRLFGALFYPLTRSAQPCNALHTRQLLTYSNINNPLFLFARNETKLPSWIFADHIPFNTSVFVMLRNNLDERELVLHEVYHLYEGSDLIDNPLGQRLVGIDGKSAWNFKEIAFDTQRRTNLRGMKLKASYPQVMFDAPTSDFAIKFRAVETILKVVCYSVNMSVEAVPLTGPITFENVLEPIWSGKAEITLVSLVMSTGPLVEKLAYLSPLRFSSSRIYIRRPEFQYSLTSVMQSFTLSTWLVSAGILLALSLAMAMVSHVTRLCGYDNEPEFSLSKSLSISLRIFRAQGWERLPISLPGRVLAISSLFFGLFLNSLFVLQLQSGLASKLSPLPFRDLDGLALTDYEFFAPPSTPLLHAIENGTTEAMQKLRTRLRYFGDDNNGYIPVNATCLEKIAVLSPKSNIDLYVDRSACPIVNSRVDLFLQWGALGTPLNFQFNKLLGLAFRRVAEIGVVKRNEIKTATGVKIFSEGVEFEVIELSKVQHFLFLYGAAVAVSVHLFIIEIVYDKFCCNVQFIN